MKNIFSSAILVLIFSGIISAQSDTLTIDQCIDIALKNNPKMKIAESSVELSDANFVNNRSVLMPQLSFQSGWTRNGGTFFSGPITRTGNYTNYNIGLQAQQMIFDFGKSYSKISASSDLKSSAEQDYISAKQDLVLSTYLAYFSYLEAQRLKTLSSKTLAQTEEHLKSAQAFFNVGRSPEFDVLKAKSDLENAKVNLINAENNLVINKLQLENTLNIKLPDNFGLKDNLEAAKESISETEALETAMNNRPELIASKYKIEANKSLVTSSWTTRLPSINATGGYNWRTYSLDEKFQNSWNIGLTLSLPIFQGFALSAGYQLAEANLKTAEAQDEIIVQNVTLDVRQQYINLKLAASRIEAAKSLLAQSEETYKIVDGRYKQGVGGPLEVTDALVSLYNAQITNLQSLYDYQVAYVRFQRAMGKL